MFLTEVPLVSELYTDHEEYKTNTKTLPQQRISHYPETKDCKKMETKDEGMGKVERVSGKTGIEGLYQRDQTNEKRK